MKRPTRLERARHLLLVLGAVAVAACGGADAAPPDFGSETGGSTVEAPDPRSVETADAPYTLSTEPPADPGELFDRYIRFLEHRVPVLKTIETPEDASRHVDQLAAELDAFGKWGQAFADEGRTAEIAAAGSARMGEFAALNAEFAGEVMRIQMDPELMAVFKPVADAYQRR